MFRNGTKSQSREKCQGCKNVYDKYQYNHKDHVIRTQRTYGFIHPFFPQKGTCDSQLSNNRQISSKEHRQPRSHIPEYTVICQPLKTGTIICCR